MSTAEIVNKVRNYAYILHDNGVGYSDYVEQITYLMFLKMADELEKLGQKVQVQSQFTWDTLHKNDGDDSEVQYHYDLDIANRISLYEMMRGLS